MGEVGAVGVESRQHVVKLSVNGVTDDFLDSLVSDVWKWGIISWN